MKDFLALKIKKSVLEELTFVKSNCFALTKFDFLNLAKFDFLDLINFTIVNRLSVSALIPLILVLSAPPCAS